MPIGTLRIVNFKSIKSLELNCKRVNLLIGEPNSGKSNILEAIGLLSHLDNGDIKQFLRFEAMTDLFFDRILDDKIEIGFDKFSFTVEFKDGRFNGSFHEKVDSQGTKIQHAFHYGYGGGRGGFSRPELRQFKFYRFVKRSEFPNPQSAFLKPPDGDNLLAVIMARKNLRRLLGEFFGKFGYRMVFRPQEGKIDIQKELEDVVFSFPYSLASETLQRVVFYLAAMHSNQNSILTFEEPEAHAFPYYTKYLAERIALEENRNQYFIATHNPYFLTSILEKTPEEEVAIFVTSLKNYQTKVKPLTKKQKTEILELGFDVFFKIGDFLA